MGRPGVLSLNRTAIEYVAEKLFQNNFRKNCAILGVAAAGCVCVWFLTPANFISFYSCGVGSCRTFLEVRTQIKQTFQDLTKHEGGLVIEPVNVNLPTQTQRHKSIN